MLNWQHRGSEHRSNDGPESAADARDAAGSGAESESLDDIVFAPVTDDLVPTGQWAAVEDGAAHVAQVLDKELTLERQRGTRTGLTAGKYDNRAGHRLAIGVPRVCETATSGQ